MPSCDEFHRANDRIANGEVQAGKLPPFMHVEGRVAWYVAQGSYSKLGEMWREVMTKIRAQKLPVMGPPGGIYVCDPGGDQDKQKTPSPIMWAPPKKMPGATPRHLRST